MKNRTALVIVFMIIGLFALTTYNGRYVSNPTQPSVNPSFLASGSPALSTAISLDSNNATSYSYDFTLFGNTYTVVAVTNSALSNFTMSKTGLGIQFQTSVPSGTIGFCNVTVPAIIVIKDISVFEDGVLLAKDVSYTEERVGTDYLFHLKISSGTHTIVIETASSNTHTPTTSPSQSQSNIPIETVVTVAAVGAVAAATVAVLYFLKGGNKPKVPHPIGGGPTNVPAGTNVTVHPDPKLRLTFSQVRQAGAATATPLSSYPSLPRGIPFRGPVFDVKTTAVFTGLVIVGLLFDGEDLTEEEKKKLRVYRNDLKKDSVWEDVTSSIDTKNNIAYGSTDHFSVFGVR